MSAASKALILSETCACEGIIEAPAPRRDSHPKQNPGPLLKAGVFLIPSDENDCDAYWQARHSS